MQVSSESANSKALNGGVMNWGIVSGLGAFALWGILPVFWKQLQIFPATYIILHRVLWSLVFLSLIVVFNAKSQKGYIALIRGGTWIVPNLFASVMLMINWTTFVYAINIGRVVEASLGYFICPLSSALLGVLLLKEKLQMHETLGIILAVLAVLMISIESETGIPWLAFVIAVTFSVYGLIRKTSKFGSLDGLFFQCLLLVLPALMVMFAYFSQENAHIRESQNNLLLLVASGPATALPLLLYAYSARRIRYVSIGVMQYLAVPSNLLKPDHTNLKLNSCFIV